MIKNLSENINKSNKVDNDFSMKMFHFTSKSSFRKIKKNNSLVTQAKISYDSGDFRKKFDLFIKNINEQTKNNLIDLNERDSEGLNITFPKRNSFNHNNKHS